MNNFIKNSALALILSISSIATAQLPDGSVAPDFTTTDVNGNTHRLYDYLDEGYTVILDISATWCGPCWNYHTGGTFEEIWEAHGPAGEPGVSPNTTDDVMILWFEGDPSTALSELENSNYGNWLNPNNAGEIQFPIINDDNIADLYDLPYWPIIYTICPNRILSESGQLSASNHYAGLGDCLQPSEGTNAAILNLQSTIESSGCEASASGNLSVVVQNMGTTNLTQFSIEVTSCWLYRLVIVFSNSSSFFLSIFCPCFLSEDFSICNNTFPACSPPITAIFALGHATINLGSKAFPHMA